MTGGGGNLQIIQIIGKICKICKSAPPPGATSSPSEFNPTWRGQEERGGEGGGGVLTFGVTIYFFLTPRNESRLTLSGPYPS